VPEPLFRDALRQATIRHAAALPIWAARLAMEGLREGPGILLLLFVDAILAVLHRRANRTVERVDWERFGQHGSWTKAFYLPEAFCVYVIVRDLLKTLAVFREWF